MSSESPDHVLRPDQLLVLYDGCCGLCRKLKVSVARMDLLGRIAFWPLQTPGLLDILGLSVERASAKVCAIDGRGHLTSGAQTVAAVVDHLLPGTPPLARLATGVPGLRSLAESGYGLVDALRHALAHGCHWVPRSRFPELPEAVASELGRRAAAGGLRAGEDDRTRGEARRAALAPDGEGSPAR